MVENHSRWRPHAAALFFTFDDIGRVGQMSALFAEAIAEAERQGDRYWFPVRLIRFYMMLPDPLPLPDRYTYIRTSPLTPWDAEAMEQGGFAIEVPGRGWIDKLHAQTVWDPMVDSSFAVDGIETNGLKQLQRPLGLHKFISVVRIWNGDIQDSAHLAQFEAVRDVRIRHQALVLKAQSSDGASPLHPSVATVRDYSVAEVVVPLFRHNDVSEKDAWNYSLSLAQDAVRHMQRALNMTRPLPLQLVANRAGSSAGGHGRYGRMSRLDDDPANLDLAARRGLIEIHHVGADAPNPCVPETSEVPPGPGATGIRGN